MGWDPQSGHLEPLTPAFMTQRPEAATWPTFTTGQIVTVRATPATPNDNPGPAIQFRITNLERDCMTLEPVLLEKARPETAEAVAT